MFTPSSRCAAATCGLAAAVAAGLSGPLGATENRLEEVVIVTSRVPMLLREVGTSLSVMNADDIRQRGFLTVPELLRTQPAVAASNNGGAGKATTLRIRGEEGFRTLVLLDGIDISDPSGPQVGPRMEQLLSSGIERIEVLRGPQGLMYGADAGGVVSIRSTRPREGFSGSLNAESGRYGTRQYGASVGGDFGAVDAILSVADFATDGFNSRSTDTVLRDNDGYENRTVHTRAGWDITDDLRVEGVLRRVEGDNKFDSCFNSAFQPSDNCSDEFTQDSWRIGAQYEAGSVQHALGISENRTERDFFADGSAFFRAEGGLRRLSYLGRYAHSDALSLVYGVDHETESIDDGSIDRDRDQTGVYGEYQGRFLDALTVTAGLRHDDNDDFGSFTSYRLSAAYVMAMESGSLKYKATYGSGFRAPSLYEVSYNRGPFALPPASEQILREEISRGYDLGVIYAGDNGSYLELTWFDQDVDDLITFDLIGRSGYIQEAGESRSKGVETALSLPLGERWTLRGNYTWNDTSTPGGDQRPFRPEHLGNLGISWQDSAGKLRLAANIRESRDAVGTAGETLDDYRLLDVNASYALPIGLTLYARLENATDERYQEIPTYLTAGRAAYAGVRYEF